MKDTIKKLQEETIAEQATGCKGAGGYRQWAKQQGYTCCEVLNWSSSAGDWSFLVSDDGENWYIMYQENNWPKPGFTRNVDTTYCFNGTLEEVYKQVENFYG